MAAAVCGTTYLTGTPYLAVCCFEPLALIPSTARINLPLFRFSLKPLAYTNKCFLLNKKENSFKEITLQEWTTQNFYLAKWYCTVLTFTNMSSASVLTRLNSPWSTLSARKSLRHCTLKPSFKYVVQSLLAKTENDVLPVLLRLMARIFSVFGVF